MLTSKGLTLHSQVLQLMKLAQACTKMNNKKLKTETALLQKSSLSLHRTIQPGVTLTAVQRKSLNALHYALQSYVRQTFGDTKTDIAKFNALYADKIMDFKIKRKAFEALISYMSRNNVYLKDVLRQLSRIQADWSNNLTGSKENYSFMNIFMEAGLEDGYVHVKIPPQTRNALVSDNVEATIDVIKISQNLNGKYAISLYELIRSYFEKEAQAGIDEFTFEIEDEILRNALNVPFSWNKKGGKEFSYGTTGKLHDKVLKPAISEVNEADFEFKVSCSHTRLGCGTLIWQFSVLKTNIAQHRLVANEFASELAEITQALKRYGVKRTYEVLSKITNERDVLYFQYCIRQVDAALRSRSKENKIQNPAGYFLKTLEQNVEAFEEEYTELQRKREEQVTKARQNELNKLEEQIQKAQANQRLKIRQAHYEALSIDEQEDLKQEYLSTVSETLGRKYYQVALEQGVEASPMIRGNWNKFLDGKFGITDDVIDQALENMPLTSTFR